MAGQFYSNAVSITIPSLPQGNYYLLSRILTDGKSTQSLSAAEAQRNGTEFTDLNMRKQIRGECPRRTLRSKNLWKGRSKVLSEKYGYSTRRPLMILVCAADKED